ncbi:MAG: tetratricopeptide repeat protein [Terrimicrobiaceae bacterium]|nr:tetratricopeptide repeat protein [Terrimicrobiaceae bacterium]
MTPHSALNTFTLHMFRGIGTLSARRALISTAILALAAGFPNTAGAQEGPQQDAQTAARDAAQDYASATPTPTPKPKRNPPQSASDAAAATAMYSEARSADESGSGGAAIEGYQHALKKYPLAPEAGNAQYRLAELLEAQGDLSRAFNAYQALLSKYPDTPNFERAVAAQVAIANQYLQGRPQKFLGIPIGSSARRAQEMYANILANAPFSKYAPVAQFNLGLAYEKQSQPFEAIKAYQKVLDTYPNSDVCDDALYQIGYVYLRIGFAQYSQDLSSLVQARNTFEDFLIEYPNSEKAPQAHENLAKLGGQEADDIYRIARFYEFSRDLKSSVIYYNDVIRRQPQSKEAGLSKSRIEELRSQYGDDALRTGPEKAETGEKAALRRRLQAQVETSALSDYAGPPKRDIVPDELPAKEPKMRTSVDDVKPLPAVEPSLPTR